MVLRRPGDVDKVIRAAWTIDTCDPADVADEDTGQPGQRTVWCHLAGAPRSAGRRPAARRGAVSVRAASGFSLLESSGRRHRGRPRTGSVRGYRDGRAARGRRTPGWCSEARSRAVPAAPRQCPRGSWPGAGRTRHRSARLAALRGVRAGHVIPPAARASGGSPVRCDHGPPGLMSLGEPVWCPADRRVPGLRRLPFGT